MNNGKRSILLSAAAVMELCWLYAWAAAAFGLTALLTYYTDSRSWTMICVLMLHAPVWAVFFMTGLHAMNFPETPFFSLKWTYELLNRPWNIDETIIFIVTSFWMICFLISGSTFSRREESYNVIRYRFDRGIAAFVILLFYDSLYKYDDPLTVYLLFPYFCMALVAFSLLVESGNISRQYLYGRKGIGMLISFFLFILFSGAGLVFFFLPYLTAAAEKGYGVIKYAVQPATPWLKKILIFLFANTPDHAMEIQNIIDSKLNASGRIAFEPRPAPDYAFLIGGVIASIFVFFITVVIVRYLFVKKNLSGSVQLKLRDKIRSLIMIVFSVFIRLTQKLLHFFRGHQGGMKYYASLLRWGRGSGMPCLPNETPSEYMTRLKNQFPSLQDEISLIVTFYENNVYGGTALDADHLSTAKSARRRLSSPVYLHLRIRAWFVQT